MDTWMIAQCMSRLPRSTYFSHPESSLDDFFAGEERTLTDRRHRGDHLSFVHQGPAPYELAFLDSLNQSLGIRPPITVGGAAEHDFGRFRDHTFSHSTSSNPETKERTTNRLLRPLNYRRRSTDPIAMPSSYGAASVANLPFLSAAASMQVPGPPAQHTVSCTEPERPQITQPPAVMDASRLLPQHQCQWEIAVNQPCGEWIEGGSKEVWAHIRREHGLKGLYSSWYHCRWGGCLERLKVSGLQRHIAKHLDIKWRCSNCDMVFARYDYVRGHIKSKEECQGAETVEYLVSEQTLGSSGRGTAVPFSQSPLNDALGSAPSEHHFTGLGPEWYFTRSGYGTYLADSEMVYFDTEPLI